MVHISAVDEHADPGGGCCDQGFENLEIWKFGNFGETEFLADQEGEDDAQEAAVRARQSDEQAKGRGAGELAAPEVIDRRDGAEEKERLRVRRAEEQREGVRRE